MRKIEDMIVMWCCQLSDQEGILTEGSLEIPSTVPHRGIQLLFYFGKARITYPAHEVSLVCESTTTVLSFCTTVLSFEVRQREDNQFLHHMFGKTCLKYSTVNILLFQIALTSWSILPFSQRAPEIFSKAKIRYRNSSIIIMVKFQKTSGESNIFCFSDNHPYSKQQQLQIRNKHYCTN